MIDLHIHTQISYDSRENAENYILEALSRSDTALGFSEHYDYDVFLGDNGFKLPSLEEIDEKVSSLNAKYKELKILKGIELGYCAKAVAHYERILSENYFDYAICSVHTLEGRGDCWFPEFFDGLSLREAYEKYFDAVLESVRSDFGFSVVGHIGYVSRNAPYVDRKVVYSEFAEIIDEILREIIARGLSLEINTSVGGSGSVFIPDIDVIDRYLELGGVNLTFGSDAHKSNDYKRNADKVKKYLLSRGVKSLCYYENREIKRYTIK